MGDFHPFSSWWFQPIRKILVKLDHFPRVRDENNKYLKPPGSFPCNDLVHHPIETTILKIRGCLGFHAAIDIETVPAVLQNVASLGISWLKTSQDFHLFRLKNLGLPASTKRHKALIRWNLRTCFHDIGDSRD